ncbi:MAG TPA: hypothetical protein VEQ85_04665 [Lacipirellulaceae bacterium]|nr:hypothetical protein [Lacipirellulaceae bacterium]
MSRRTRQRRRILATCGLLALAGGCGGDDAALLGAYLGEVEFDAPLEAAASIPLGSFDIPASTPFRRKGADGSERNVWMRIKFDLFVETPPKSAAAVEEAFTEHRGAFNDAVLTIVRSSSTDELTDPRCSALRMRIAEAARPLLGENRVRQVVVYPYTLEEL